LRILLLMRVRESTRVRKQRDFARTTSRAKSTKAQERITRIENERGTQKWSAREKSKVECERVVCKSKRKML